MSELATSNRTTAIGPGRVLALVYAFFTLAAGARSGVQLATHPSRAPVAYALSGLAAFIYLAGTLTIAYVDQQHRHRRRAIALCCVELAGVVIVGVVSVITPAAFPDATVWSQFGAGYGYVPLVLPVLGLAWLRYWRRPRGDGAAQPGG